MIVTTISEALTHPRVNLPTTDPAGSAFLKLIDLIPSLPASQSLGLSFAMTDSNLQISWRKVIVPLSRVQQFPRRNVRLSRSFKDLKYQPKNVGNHITFTPTFRTTSAPCTVSLFQDLLEDVHYFPIMMGILATAA